MYRVELADIPPKSEKLSLNPKLSNAIAISADVKDLMLAVTARRTVKFFSKLHFCK